MHPAAPTITLPARLREVLAERGRLAEVEAYLAQAPRPCIYAHSERASTQPLVRSWLGRKLGLAAASPVLRPLASKLGGVPYGESADETWTNFIFVGQINFAELPVDVDDAPREGILRLDLGTSGDEPFFRTRWYPTPSEDRFVAHDGVRSVGAWEARLLFRPGWSLPEGKAWNDALSVPQGDALCFLWRGFTPSDFAVDEHRILGHRRAGVDEAHKFEPPAGASRDVRDYEMLLEVGPDAASGVEWGSNVVYVLVHRDDLVAGRLDRAVVTFASL